MFNKFVASTGAKRSGEICGLFPVPKRLKPMFNKFVVSIGAKRSGGICGLTTPESAARGLIRGCQINRKPLHCPRECFEGYGL